MCNGWSVIVWKVYSRSNRAILSKLKLQLNQAILFIIIYVTIHNNILMLQKNSICMRCYSYLFILLILMKSYVTTAQQNWKNPHPSPLIYIRRVVTQNGKPVWPVRWKMLIYKSPIVEYDL